MTPQKKLSRSHSLLAFGLGVLLCLLPACQQSKDKQTPRPAASDSHQETADTHTRTGTEQVHALLILLGNERGIRASVNATESKMLEVLRQVSLHSTVNLTLMKSSTEVVGSTTIYTLRNGRTSNPRGGKSGGLIRSSQVVDWLSRLKFDEDDTVLIYYNGHGTMDRLGTHSLQFDSISLDTLDRERLGKLLNQKRARLRMFITDTCSESIDAEEIEYRPLARTRERKRNYMEDLFLGHAGFLDITAASPGEVAVANPEEGGHFTHALFTHGCAPDADKNNDAFITWQEAFRTAGAETNRLFKQASKELNEVLGRRSNRQKTQKPVAYSLPSRIGGGGGGSAPSTPLDTPPSTATLNFTSVPSGAEVSIDGFVVGQTPLTGYELETDGQSAKGIEVTVKAEGYEDVVKELRVRRGYPLNWEFELTKKELAKTLTATLNFTSVPSGAEVSIDGFGVGQTPLTGYELETDGQSAKGIEVTVKAEGYEDAVKELRVRRGYPLNWEFALTKKELAKTLIGQDGVEMMLIPAGEFQMGSNTGDGDEKPVHTVYVDAFYMDKYEVTNAQYKRFVDAKPEWRRDRISDNFHNGDYLKHWNGNNYRQGRANHPVIYVSWYGAMAYAQWAGKRLPTEAEWEKAARGGKSGLKYPWGNTISGGRANYGRSVGDTRVVGSYAANGYGVYDMSGNVWEWCLDAYAANFYSSSPRRNPLGGVNTLSSADLIINDYTNVKSSRVLRGGSWSDTATSVRVAGRSSLTPASTSSFDGFRCARTVSP